MSGSTQQQQQQGGAQQQQGGAQQQQGGAQQQQGGAQQQQQGGAQQQQGGAQQQQGGAQQQQGGAQQQQQKSGSVMGAGDTRGSILADTQDGSGDGASQLKEPTADEVTAFVAKIKQVDMSSDDGGPAPAWDDAAVKVVAPLLLKHGVSDAAANEIISAYASHVSAQYRAAMDTDRKVLEGLRTECQKRFGKDLKRFAAEGRRGGEHVFGKDLFARLAAVEAFGSDPDIVDALAKIGRTITPDSAPGGSSGSGTEKDLASRMYPGL